MVFILQPCLVEYRIPFYNELIRIGKFKFRVIAGDKTLSQGVTAQTVWTFDWFRKVRNRFFPSIKCYWQDEVLWDCFQAGVCVVNVNPRNISVWLVILFRWIARRPTIGWGHLHSRTRGSPSRNVFRYVQYYLCDGVALYSISEVESSPVWMKQKLLVGLQNSCVEASSCRVSFDSHPKDLIYVGRLEQEKNVYTMVQAFSNIIMQIGDDVRLILVGRGGEEERIRRDFAVLIESGRVVLQGWIWDNELLFDLYQRSAFALSPGFVGLNAIQAFAFGVPMIVSLREPHSPEVAACVAERNTIFYDDYSNDSLERAILRGLAAGAQWMVRREAISAEIKEKWTVERMAARFSAIILKMCPKGEGIL